MYVQSLARSCETSPARGDHVRRLLRLRIGEVAADTPAAAAWIVVRGCAHVSSTLGQHSLRTGQWLVLDQGCRPAMQVGHKSLVLSLEVGPAMLQAWREHGSRPLSMLGAGRIGKPELRTMLRVWREQLGRRDGAQGSVVAVDDIQRLHWLLQALEAPFQSQVDACPGQSRRRRRQIFLRMQRARLQLDGNQERVIRVSELAQANNFSLWYFTKIFHNVYGITPQRYAAEGRLAQACRLLAQGDLSISDVAAACGFENPCSFARAFRSRHGETASHFRERLRGAVRDTAGGRAGAMA